MFVRKRLCRTLLLCLILAVFWQGMGPVAGLEEGAPAEVEMTEPGQDTAGEAASETWGNEEQSSMETRQGGEQIPEQSPLEAVQPKEKLTAMQAVYGVDNAILEQYDYSVDFKTVAEDMYAEQGPLVVPDTLRIAADAMYGESVAIPFSGAPSIGLMSIPSSYTTITFPSIHTVTINTGGTSKWFRFTAPASKKFAMKAISNGLDTKGYLYNSAGTQIATSNYGKVMHNYKDTHIYENLTAGSVYYLEVNLGTKTGSFSMYFYEDDHADGVYNSTSLTTSPGYADGVINYAQDRDMFAFTPSTTGRYLFSTTGSTPTVGGIYDFDCNQLASSGSSSGNFSMQYNMTRGTTYYIEVRHQSTTGTGAYRLHVSQPSIDVSNASPISEYSVNTVTLNNASDAKVYKFVPTQTKRYCFKAISSYNTWGALYDHNGQSLATCDTGCVTPNQLDFHINEVLTAGETYYLYADFASGSGVETGSFPVYFYPDDYLDGMWGCSALTVEQPVYGTINYSQDRDMFTYSAPAYTEYVFYTTGSTNTVVSVYNSSRSLVATASTGGAGSNARLQVLLEEGDYYVEVRHGTTTGTGDYTLYVSRTQATTVAQIYQNTTTTVSIPANRRVKLYKFVPPASGVYTFRTTSNNRNTYGDLTDASGNLINQSINAGMYSNNTDSCVMANLTAGQAYYFATKFIGDGTGSYTVSVYPDDHHDGSQWATEIASLSTAPASGTAGAIQYAGDHDVFKFTPLSSGNYMVSTTGTSLSCSIYNSSRTSVASDTNGGNVEITYYMVAGSTYYIDLGHYSSTGTGDYMVYISSPQIGTADAVTITAPSTATVNITSGGAAKIYRFVPTENARYAFKAISSLDTWAALYNHLGMQIAYCANGQVMHNPLDFHISEELVAGQTYYLVAKMQSGSATGSFPMYVYQDDCPDGKDFAPAITTGTVNGQIDYIYDRDMRMFTPDLSGSYSFYTTGTTDTFGTLYGHSGISLTPLITNDDGGTGTNFKITCQLEAGVDYFIETRQYSTGTGSYTLHVDFDGIPGATEMEENTTALVWMDEPGQPEAYRFVPQSSGRYAIRAVSNATTYGKLYSSSGLLLAEATYSNIAPNNRDFYITCQMTAGQTYYITTGLTGSDARGSYLMHVYPDTHGDSIAEATPLIAEGTVNACIDYSQDRDVFSFTAPSSARYIFSTTGATALRGKLMNASGTYLTQAGDGGNISLAYNLSAGQSYYLELSHPYTDGTGEYTLQVNQDFYGDGNPDSLPEGSLTMANSENLLSFVPSQTGRYTIKSVSDNWNIACSLTDSSHNSILINYDGSMSHNSGDFSISCDLIAGNSYLLQTIILETGSGNYGLIAYPDDHAEGFGNSAAELTMWTSMGGTIANTYDKDVFRFTPISNGDYVFAITGADTAGGALYNSAGESLGGVTRGLSHTLSAGQTYYLEISGNGGESYSVSVEQGGSTLVPVTASQGEIVDVVFRAGAEAGGLTATYTVDYDPAKLEVYDLCGFTYKRETAPGFIPLTGIVIVQNTTTGSNKIIFTVTNGLGTSQRVDRAANIIRFKAKANCSAESVTWSVTREQTPAQ